MMDFEEKYKKLEKNISNGWNNSKIARSQLKIIREFVSFEHEKTERVLDLGCGDGKLTLLLAENIEKVHGIDISSTAISWAKKRARKLNFNANFQEADVRNLPYKDNFFDLIIDSFCFHCIIGNDRKIFLQNMLRVLTQKGSFIVMTKCGDPKDESYPFNEVSRCKVENGIRTRYWGKPEDILTELKNAGFFIIKWKIYSFNQDLLVIKASKK